MKLKTAVLITLLPIAAMANPVTVTLEGVGVSDGVNYVLPYDLSINGAPAIPADCYDFLDPITIGYTWSANFLTLAQASTSGRFSGQPGALFGYELVGALSSLPAPTAANQIDLQHALWDVFDPGYFAETPGVAAYDAAAVALVPTFDYSKVEYLEPVKGVVSQTFVLPVPGGVPEPGTMMLLGSGLVAIGIWRRRV